MSDKIIIFSTCASAEEARKIARHLVEMRLAACASIGAAPVESIYHWRGAIEEARETTLALKTRRGLMAELERELRRLHSYETPEIVAVPIVDGSEDYMAWLEAELKPEALPLGPGV